MIISHFTNPSNKERQRQIFLQEKLGSLSGDICPLCGSYLYIAACFKMLGKLVLRVELYCQAGHYEVTHNFTLPRDGVVF